MGLNISDEYFGELLPFIKDDTVTDITWNGRDLWLDDLKKGRYKSNVKLSDQFVQTFSTRIANLANKNFNLSEPLLEAETDNLRISIVDDTVTNTSRSIAIRKTPAVRRLNELGMLESGYAEAMVLKLLKALVRGHSSVIVTGDVGSGKTELVKYLTKFIPNYERTISIEDNYELRLSSINPKLDCVEIKATQDGPFSYQMAIKAALRQLCKWLLMAEARSKEVVQLLEAASTGCIVMTTLHSDDVRKIPDRVVNMMGMEGEEKRNDVYNFFDVGIKVGIEKTDKGIKRSIDQICVMDRDNNENELYLIYNKGFTGTTLPRNLWQKVVQGAKNDIELFEFLKPENADVMNLAETPEFANQMSDLEEEMREALIRETTEAELEEKYGESETVSVDEIADAFEEVTETESLVDDLIEGGAIEEEDFEMPMTLEEALHEIEEQERIQREEERRLEEQRLERERMQELAKQAAREKYEAELREEELRRQEELQQEELSIDDLFDEELLVTEDDLDFEEPEIKIDDLIDEEIEGEIFEEPEASEAEESIDDLMDLFDKIPGLNIRDFENMTREELVAELKKQMTVNWVHSLSTDELAAELRREIRLVEKCNAEGIPIPDEDRLKIQVVLGGMK